MTDPRARTHRQAAASLAARTAELAGIGCALAFAHAVWPPLVLLGLAVLLLAVGQLR